MNRSSKNEIFPLHAYPQPASFPGPRKDLQQNAGNVSNRTAEELISRQGQLECDDQPLSELNAGDAVNEEASKAESDRQLKQIHRSVARSFESMIKDYLVFSLGSHPASIRKIQFDEDGLVMTINLPMPLLDPSEDPGQYPPSRAKQQLFRINFAKYISQTETRLARFFYTRLVNFLIDTRITKKCSQAIVKLLRRIAQRELAGRPARSVPSHLKHPIRVKGESIKRAIVDIQARIKNMKARNKQLTTANAIKHLRRAYPSDACPWMPHFLKIANDLPQRRYVPSSSSDSDFTANAGTDCNFSSSRITEPEYWSVPETTVRVLQAMLLAETDLKFPLREIRKLLK